MLCREKEKEEEEEALQGMQTYCRYRKYDGQVATSRGVKGLLDLSRVPSEPSERKILYIETINVTGGSFTQLPMETYGCPVKPVMQFLGTVDTSAAFSASAGSVVTPSSFMVGTL
jgi:hypothetical protein